MTEETPTYRTWADVLDGAARQPEPDRRRLLATALLARDALSPGYASGDPRPGRFPDGRPTKIQTRQAASDLLTLPGTAEPDPSNRTAQTVLAHMLVVSEAQAGPGEVDELALRSSHCRLGVDLARETDNPTMVAWALKGAAHAAEIERAWTDCLAMAAEAADLLEPLLPELRGDDYSARFGLFAAAGGLADWARPSALNGRILFCQVLSRVRTAARALGDLDTMEAALNRARPVAHTIRTAAPVSYLNVLGGTRDLARTYGDLAAFPVIEEDLRQWIAQDHRPIVTRALLTHQLQQARTLCDWEQARQLHQRRLDIVLNHLPDAPKPSSPSAAYQPLGDHLLATGRQVLSNKIANDAYDIAYCLERSGAADSDTDTWAEAHAWLNLAAHLWASYGTNGLLAVRLSRARLELPHVTDEVQQREWIDEVVHVAGHAVRTGLRDNAAMLLPFHAVPGDARVQPLLDRLAGLSPPVPRGRFLAAEALWASREADAGIGATRWRDAEKTALAGLQLLTLTSPDDTATTLTADPEWAAEAWQVAAAAAEALHRDQGVVLKRLVAGAVAVGQQLVRVTDLGHRGRLAARWAPLLARALHAAVDAGDPAAVDTVAEVARRDRIGVLVTELRRTPDLDKRLRDLLDRLTVAEEAVPDTITNPDSAQNSGPAAADDEESPGPDLDAQDRGTRSAAAAIGANRLAARAAVDEALGVLGALANPDTTSRVRARDILSHPRRPTRHPAALLQLISSTAPMLHTNEAPDTLTRRLTLHHADGQVEEHVDQIPLPAWLIQDAHAPATGDGPLVWTRQPRTLLPPPLLHALEQSGPDRPLRLLVLPGALHRLPLAALRLPDHSLLLDKAVITHHTSLTVTRHLLDHTVNQQTATEADGIAAVYDTAGLDHTAAEHDILASHFTPLADLAGVADLRRELTEDARLALFAMAVHGSRDHDGWGQTKHLPDGTTLTAAQALTLTFPGLCVIASCHTNIEDRTGLEQSGFPLAMAARGAHTVLGTLWAVPDDTTSRIMRTFWAELAATHDPPAALRAAQRHHLHYHPHHRTRPYHWAGLITHGATHH